MWVLGLGDEGIYHTSFITYHITCFCRRNCPRQIISAVERLFFIARGDVYNAIPVSSIGPLPFQLSA